MPEIKHKKKKKSMLTPQGWWDSPIAGKVHFQSSYEKKFCEWLDSHNVVWKKNKDRFTYTSPLDNKEHKYVPDFQVKLGEEWVYVETKGMVRIADPAKFEAFPEDKKLVLLGYEELKSLGIEGLFDPMSIPKMKGELKPDQWPYKLLQNMPDFAERGELSESLKAKVSAKKFLETFSSLT